MLSISFSELMIVVLYLLTIIKTVKNDKKYLYELYSKGDPWYKISFMVALPVRIINKHKLILRNKRDLWCFIIRLINVTKFKINAEGTNINFNKL